MPASISAELLSDCINHLQESTKRVETCLQVLTEEQVWHKPNESSNSIANLILHLCGNMTQYVLSSLGNQPDSRERDQEFLIKGGLNKTALFEKLSSTVAAVILVLEKFTEKSLLQIKSVQGFSKSGVGIIVHVTEHFSYHTGQITLLTKLITNKNLDFYKGYNLNTKNS